MLSWQPDVTVSASLMKKLKLMEMMEHSWNLKPDFTTESPTVSPLWLSKSPEPWRVPGTVLSSLQCILSIVRRERERDTPLEPRCQ